MSGELRATEDWTYVEPADAKPRKQRKPKRLPQTTLGMMVYGLRRFVEIGAALCAGVALAAFLVATLSGRHFTHVLTLAYYIAGAVLGATALASGRMGYVGPAERESAFNRSFAVFAFAALMVGIAIALEVFL
jgi:hypothetical protein